MSTVAQRRFSGGELSPALRAGVDLLKYQVGLATCRNSIIMRHGGSANRPMTSFIGEVKDSTKRVRMIPFEFNPDQTYILEFGDQYMRVIRQGAYITDLTLTITGITNANPAVLSYTGTDPVNGQEVAIAGVLGAMGQFVNNRNFKIANVNGGANTFELHYMDNSAVNSTTFGAYGGDGTASRIFEIVTPYLEADLPLLKFVQSVDIITITHQSYAPRDLRRLAHASWTLTTILFVPDTPTPVIGLSTTAFPVSTPAPGPGTAASYLVTAVDVAGTYEESLPQLAGTSTSTVPSAGTPIFIEIFPIGAQTRFNVYKFLGGAWGFIGICTNLVAAGHYEFKDNGIVPIQSITPPQDLQPYNTDFPACVTIYQQRKVFANTPLLPEQVRATRTGNYKNFTPRTPIQDDDALSFTMAGRQVNAIKHLLDLGTLVLFTGTGEHVAKGDDAGILKPTAINRKQHSYNGSSDLAPIIVDGNALYVQARGAIVRDLGFDVEVDGYRGNDLTTFANHLFDSKELISWTYQKIPHSILWVVRDDGTMLGLTYVRDQQIFAWHRHDMDGTIEDVCSVPEGDEDAVYVVVKRTINGASKRYIERMNTRSIVDIIDYVGMDSELEYDGRNTGSRTMTLSGGTTWDHDETQTLTASSAFFTAADVGNAIFFYNNGVLVCRLIIEGFTSTTVVTVRPDRLVPVAYRTPNAILEWTRAVDQITGLWHIEGERVSVFGDGFVVASPNNADYDVLTVTNGAIDLPEQYGVVHIGLPVISDIELLDIDTVNGETLANKKSIVTDTTLHLEKSRGIWVGSRAPSDDSVDPLENLTELKMRNEEGYDSPVDLATTKANVQILGEWESNGRVFIRQVDPLPISVTAVMPAGMFPLGRAGG